MIELKDFPGYFITEDGQVWSNKRGKLRLKKAGKCRQGYPRVSLVQNFKEDGKICYIHRLVAETFIPNPNNLPHVLHKDDNPANCHKDNLFWGTHGDNMRDMFAKGRDNRTKLTPQQVQELRDTPYTRGMFKTFSERWGVSVKRLRHIYQRKSYTWLP